MQEEIESRTIALVVDSAKFTSKQFIEALNKYVAYRENKGKKEIKPQGKMSLKELASSGQELDTRQLDSEIRYFDKIARSYGVDYSIKRDRQQSDRYIIFFKAQDRITLDAAIREYTVSLDRKEKNKESLVRDLEKAKEKVKGTHPINKRRERER